MRERNQTVDHGEDVTYKIQRRIGIVLLNKGSDCVDIVDGLRKQSDPRAGSHFCECCLMRSRALWRSNLKASSPSIDFDSPLL